MRRGLDADDADHQQGQEQQAGRRGRLAVGDHADERRADRADPDPHDVGRAERDALTLQNANLGMRSLQQNEHVAVFAGKMFTLAGEWDDEQERLENKLIIEKQQTANAEAIIRLTQDALAQANEEITAYKLDAETWKDRYRSKSTDFWNLNAKFERLVERGIFARLFNR